MWSQPAVSPPSKNSMRFSNQPLALRRLRATPPESSLATIATPELQDVLSFSGDTFPFSALLGRCDDGAALLFDLSNPKSSSILVLGGKRCGKTQLLRTVALSVCQLNPPELVSFYIFASQIDRWTDLAHRQHCLRMQNPNNLSARRSISKLTEYASHRQSTRLHSPALILFIDNLDQLLENHLSGQLIADLSLLAKDGPKSLIWTIASIDSAKLASLPLDLVSCFTILIFGKSLPGQLDALSSRLNYIDILPPFLPGGFIACFNQVQIRFRTLLG